MHVHDFPPFNTTNFFEQIVFIYKHIGPFGGFLLAFSESYLPFLPLTAIVIGNAATFGFIPGFFISALGSILGTIILYFICNYFGTKRFIKKFTKHKHISKYTSWMNNHGSLLVALCYLLPVLPNFLCAFIAGINNFSFKKFAISCSIGTAGQFYFLSFIGSDLITIAQHPFKIFLFFLFWISLFLGKNKVMLFLNTVQRS